MLALALCLFKLEIHLIKVHVHTFILWPFFTFFVCSVFNNLVHPPSSAVGVEVGEEAIVNVPSLNVRHP